MGRLALLLITVILAQISQTHSRRDHRVHGSWELPEDVGQPKPSSSEDYENYPDDPSIETLVSKDVRQALENSNSLDDSHSQQQHHSHHNHNHHHSDTSAEKKKHCKTCQNVLTMSEDEVTALRIEFVKNQILKKLRLSERPQVSAADLPRPITEGIIPVPEEVVNRQSEDYYAKTTKKFIFLQEAFAECKGLEMNEPFACLKFQIPADVDVEDVHSAHLWVYKRHEDLDAFSETLGVSEVSHWDKERQFLKAVPIALSNTNTKEGWVKIDISWPIKNWFKYHDLTHVISVSCKTCVMDPNHSPICLKHKRKPFIVIDTYAQRKHSRPKRNINCSSGTKECCREKVYISFAEIGWDDWILYPAGYDAYFCRGTCDSAASVTLSGSSHASVLRKMALNRKNTGGKQLELIPCCTATQYSSLQLFYMDSNNTATQKTLPNMIVSSCGCS